MNIKNVFLLFSFLVNTGCYAQKQGDRKIIIITFDGLRWKDVFRGADSVKFFPKLVGLKDSALRGKKIWAHNREEKRKKLMPFFWETIAIKGQIYGNRDLGSLMNVKNRYWFSYPGYNEMFTGYPDTLINSNDFRANPNTTIQEFVNKQPGYKNSVAAFASWEAFSRILNKERCGFPVNAGYQAVNDKKPNKAQQALSDVQFLLPKVFGRNERPDAVTYFLAKEYLKEHHPKVLQISFIETDAYGHRDSYENYLESAYNNDKMIKDLWDHIQTDPFYKDQTVLFLTTDHGRGEGDKWKNHSSKIPEADQIWFAVMGAGIKTLGETQNNQIYQNQLALTIAAILGVNFITPYPKGEAIEAVTR
jgi:hypothetical protein